MMEGPVPVPDKETLQQETDVAAQALYDSVQQRSSRETGRFLNSLPDYLLKELFPTSTHYHENGHHHDNEQSDRILPSVRELLPVLCEKGDLPSVLVLLNYGADPCIKGAKGSPLELATLHNQSAIIDKLISWNKALLQDVSQIKSCIARACEGGHSELVTFWLEHLGTVSSHRISSEDFSDNDPVAAACKGGHTDIAAKLLTDGISHVSKDTSMSYPDVLTDVLDLWVEEDSSHDQPFDQTADYYTLKKLAAKWTKKNLHVFDQAWLRAPRYAGVLISIDLSYNGLSTIPGALLWGLPWLERLTITHNAVDKLPGPVSLNQLDNLGLRSLNMSHNQLKTVPAELFMLPRLEYLSLSDNHIKSINPAHIALMFTPEEGKPVWKCTNLKRLVLSNNKLLKIPSDIRVARQLTKMDVSHNNLKEVPSPWDCPLEELQCHHNSITDVPDMHACWHRTLKILNLGHNKLTEIPWTICRLQCLLRLTLCHNNIWRLPAINEWAILNLQDLDLSGNLLVNVDLGISRTMSTASSISQNSTTDETSSRHSSTASAERASPEGSTSSTFFISMPDGEGEMLLFPSIFNKGLRALDLSCNQLQAVPDSVCDMQALQVLDLHGNGGLTSLPHKMGLLTNLYSLRLDHDQISHPAEVTMAMQQLERPTQRIMQILVDKLHNSQPYRGLKMMIVGPEKCGKTSLLSCLTNTDWPENDKGVNIKQWRLSSSLVSETRNSLSQILFRKQTSERGEDDINFTIWDLKGGDTYSVIHQTLFTPRTLYLLVWDIRDKEDGIRQKLYPWILNIQAQAPESTIIVVGTHLDKLPSRTEQRQATIESVHQTFRQAFPRLRESCVTQNCFVEVQATGANGAGIRELKEAIYDCASAMTFNRKKKKMQDLLVGRKVPSAFIVLKDRVMKDCVDRQAVFPPVPPIMTEAQLTDHVRTIEECHVNNSQDLEEAVEFLRDSGSLVHVSDHTFGLTNLYFLDPAWLCSVLLAVVKLKDNETFNTSEGIVSKLTLQELCEESGFGSSRFDEYIQLLARFEIALPVSLNRFVIPSLLPKIAPVIEHTRNPVFKHKLQRWYKMSYIPPGFWSRLVSRLMVNIRHMDKKISERRKASSMRKPSHGSLHMQHVYRTVWQEGMYVQYDGGQIMIEPMYFKQDGDKPGIRVTIMCRCGIFQAMGFVIDHIESLLEEWYPGLDDQNQETGKPLVERLVPCPLCVEHAIQNEDPYGISRAWEDNVHVFHLKQLILSATLKAQDNIECPGHKETLVSLKQLLPDVFMLDLRPSYLLRDKLVIEKRLGVGGFGEVHKAMYDGRPIAVKSLMKAQFNKLPPDSETDQDSCLQEEQEISVVYKFPKLRSEVAMMARLKHPCIIKLIGVSIQQLSFAMEFAPLGDLSTYIERKFSEAQGDLISERTVHRTLLPRMLTYKITHQVSTAIQYLHRMRIIHTDLKTDNVLMCSTDPSESVNVKLADYGISHTLFAGGVKGAAGFHAFCAPEILKGKAFDEKVDWFSFGMLVYHLISGLLPFHELYSSLETKSVVTAGGRPSLTYADYSIMPRFAHLEGLMRWCWKDSPADRPSKEEVLHCLRDASFLCLRHRVELESEATSCLYSATSSQTEDEDIRQYRMWLWKGKGESRSYTKFNLEHSAQMRPKDCQGVAVTCTIQVGEFNVLGTMANELQVYGVQGAGRQLFTHLYNRQVTAGVLCLCYSPVNSQTTKLRTKGHLFAGLADGTIVIFTHTSKPQGSSSRSISFHLMQRKVITLTTVPKPCQCMQLIPEKQELWASCGNILRVLCIQELLLDPIVITVSPEDRQLVKGMAYNGKQLWCFVEDGSQVVQYNVETRMWEDTLQCGSLTPSKQQCLSNPITAKHPMDKEESLEKEEDVEVEDEVGTLAGGENDGYNGEADSGNDMAVESDDLQFHEDHFNKPARAISRQQNRATMPSGLGRSGKRRTGIRRSRRPFSDGSFPTSSAAMFAKVTALLVVKDTLWIGRDTGDVLVVNIDKDSPCDYRFGEVLAVLAVQSFLGWPHGAIRQLLPVGSNRVVASRNVTRSDAQLRHQLLVWENWGSQEFHEFEEVHYALEKAKKDQVFKGRL